MKKLLTAALLLLSSIAYAQTSGLPGPIFYATATGSVNVLAVTQPGALLATGQVVTFLPNLANTTTTPTLAVNGLTAKTITKMGQVALLAGDLTTTAVATVVYDGTDWELQNPQTEASFPANKWMGNPGGSAGAPGPSLLGAYDVSVPSYVAAGGSVNVLTVTLAPAVPAYAVGLTVNFIPNLANTTTTPTLNVNGLGAKTITKFGQSALAVNDLLTTAVASVIYDGTDFELQNPATLSSSGSTTALLVASEESVASSATPTFSLSYRESTNVLTANVTSFTLASGTAGQDKTLTFCQNATGGFTVAAPTNVHGFMTVGTTLSKCSSQHFTYNSTQTAWIADGPGVVNE